MTGVESNVCTFTNKKYPESGDLEAGRNIGHANNKERNISSVKATLEKMTAKGNTDESAVDIDKCASSLARILDDVPQYMCNRGHPGRISRIPENLCEVDLKAYEPYIVSIGPYHHGRPRVQKMEKRKWVLLKYFLAQNPELTLKDYLREIKSIEPAARSFYSDVEMDSETFGQMLLLDSLFILPIFCGFPGSLQTNSETENQINEAMRIGDDNLSRETRARADESKGETSGENTDEGERWVWSMIPQDLFLLENQLPFFVLEKMYMLAYGDPETQLISILKDRVGLLLSDYVKLDIEMIISPTEEVHHLLHLCHMFFRPKLQNETIASELPESGEMFRLGSAVQLYEAGVSFDAISASVQHSLLDISFTRSGKITMPCLHVDDRIGSLLRNLMALEQMKYPSLGLHISAYVVLLLHLITTPDDVHLLRRKGVIQHHLASDKDMAYFVNRLSVGLSFDYVEDEYSLKLCLSGAEEIYRAQTAPLEGLDETQVFQQSMDDNIIAGCIASPHPHYCPNLLYRLFLLPSFLWGSLIIPL